MGNDDHYEKASETNRVSARFYTAMLSAGGHAQDVPRVPSGTFEEENRDRVGPVSDPVPTFRIERPSPGAQAAASDVLRLVVLDLQANPMIIDLAVADLKSAMDRL